MTNTIAAVSTAYGRGGIAVIRISGDEAITVAEKMFHPANGKALSEVKASHAVYGDIVKRAAVIDNGICTIFRAPHSYTGENVVEISCHGGIILTEKVLEAAFESGAVPAGAGEFTKRAFTNGKLSLSQAEAVGMLIDAESEEQLSLAASHGKGVIKRKADELYEKLKTIVTGVFANVDFPDEDLAELSDEEVLAEIKIIEKELAALQSSYKVGRAVLEGIRTVIIGKPNTGKSSLLNRLVGRERAIVTDIAGTTRDTIEESVALGRVMLRLIDTAGIRESNDAVEKIGVERSLKELSEAELVLALFDLSNETDGEDSLILDRLKNTNATKIAVLNKSDLSEKFDRTVLENGIFTHTVEISAAENVGIDELKELINSLYIEGEIDYNSRAVITNARQNASVSHALEYVRSAMRELESGVSADTAGFDLEAALSSLAELDGRRVTEEIVDGIFHRFCVGK
ncbi:MAG: tRNA uridine-5-carboxymethylaminomethyl(34) synthesis GTPase MnmE [Clostridia bacterium]|nr:tRNA uridine-5-carboxymethylaminomethyl(34) synthesis GTPase MnmE [Clostridia bacterium]